MRKLVVFRGHQGSGKSHTIKALGLEDWTLSSDNIRNIVSSPVLTSHGTMMINQDATQQTFAMIEKLSDERMARGETLVIDTTGLQIRDFDHWRAMAAKHRYEIAWVDMTDVPLETALARQADRHETRRVPRVSLERFLKIMRENPLTVKDARVETLIKGGVDDGHVAALRAWLEEPILDLNGYQAVEHIGDIQGCHSVLVRPGGPFEHGFRDDTFYVFIGDLLDRGIENGKVMRWFVDEALERDNVALMWGNHEDHIHRFARGMEPVSNEFKVRTLPQLLDAGITPEDADRVCAKAKEFMVYRFDGKTVFANHAGLSTFPKEPWRVAASQFSKGTGYYSDDVDGQFAANTDGSVVQVHGHRNLGGRPVRATSTSFNLEDSVEFGGNLRTCRLDRTGWSTMKYKNTVFRSLRERLSMERKMSESRMEERRKYPAWILDNSAPQSRFDDGLLAAMNAHPGVNERPSETVPGIVSLNFTRDVFQDKAWDDVVVKARGLFYDKLTQETAIRGYDKFFNVGERADTMPEHLADTMRYPLTIYLKENGYLGNLGYVARVDAPLVASKSSTEGKFAGWFKGQLDGRLDEEGWERVRRYLRDTESSMTFEVIDPVNDPHIIEYDAPNIVLLDVVRRSTDFQRAAYDTLLKAADHLGFEPKQRAFSIKNAGQFKAWLKSAEKDMEYRFQGKHVEGFVIEDSAGYMTKWKSPYYRFWKQMRSQHMRVSKMLQNSQMPKDVAISVRGQNWMSEEMIEQANSFTQWMLTKTPDTIGNDIISARNAYLRDSRPTMSLGM